MSRVSRKRTITAAPDEVWSLVSDPYGLPRWWPRTTRVEDVRETDASRRSQWTMVLETKSGRGVRADYRCISSARGERYIWEQMVEGTPFEKHMRKSVTEISFAPAGDGTKVTITLVRTLRGLSRLGSPMMRGAAGSMLDDALDGLQQALEQQPPT